MNRILPLIACIIAFNTFSADWKPAPGPLLTRWAKDVSPDKTLPEYPRPQMVRERWLNLNGLWQYALPTEAPKDADLPIGKDLPDTILVPFPVESALSGVMKRSERITYRRTFEVPKEWKDNRVLLHFGAVNWESVVFVNGKKVAEHKGGYDPFSAEITDALKDGPQELIVTAFNPADKGEQPRGKQVNKPGGIFYLPSTGIWQTVWIEPVPNQHIWDLEITPDVDNKSLTIQVHHGVMDNVQITAEAFLKNGDQSESVGKVEGKADTFKIPISNLKLWSPDSPTLYDLTIKFQTETVKSYFAMRKISLGQDNGVTKILLNDKFVFQMGELDQGFWPDGLYTAPTDEALKYDIEIAKELGFNMIRKHVKVEPQRWYYWADKLGVIVWQDMPSGESTHIENKKRIPRSGEAAAQHELELKSMIENLRNHPSIVLWVVFNEGWGQYDTERITDWVKKFDPTRLADNASGWTDKKCGDVIDMHNYPGPGCPPPEEKRAAVLGEFGGIGYVADGHQWVKSDKNWGYNGLQKTTDGVTRRYEQLLRKTYDLVAKKGLSAAVYTQITDVETESNGLLSYDRAVIKADAKRIAAANKGEFATGPIKELVPTSEQEPQKWRFTTQKPADEWMKPVFDDSKWTEAPGGFGTKGTPGAIVRTEWKTNDIWLRRTVDIQADSFDNAVLIVHHDDDVKIYINGILAAEAPGYFSQYEDMELTPEGRKALKKGANVIAVHCHQNAGGQYIDVGLSTR